MIGIFVIGYIGIIFESVFKINKTAIAIVMAVGTWTVFFLSKQIHENDLNQIDLFIGHASQIIFFLIGAMTLVELIDAHKGFKIITDAINTRSKRKLFYLVGFISFFLSAILDNLTATIVMISLLKKIIHQRNDRLLLGALVVIASNAGGAWTPIGDVTTTMLWIKGQVSTLGVIKALFMPSVICLFSALLLLGHKIKGCYPSILTHQEGRQEPGAKVVFSVGVGALLFVPIFKGLTGLPPFMGMLIGLGVLWMITDLMHYKHEEKRSHLRVPYILTKIDTSGVLFFLGILLSISALEAVGLLEKLAVWLNYHIQNKAIIATLLGFLSSIVDNVPLVAACTGMYDLQTYPIDSDLWQMIAYAAGTGGSILIIGSAAGVAFMGLEKVDFLWYFKKISLSALAAFLIGMVSYLLFSFV